MTRLDEVHVFLRGGLGNQLFQYSTGFHISQETGKKLVIRADLLPETQDSIGNFSRWPNQINSFQHSGEVRVNSFQPHGKTNLFGKIMQVMRTFGDTFPRMAQSLGWLTGEIKTPELPNDLSKISAINSYAPYKHLAWLNRNRIRNEIHGILDPSSAFINLSAEMKRHAPTIIHVRQGDYANLKHIYGEPNQNFYKKALNLLASRTLSPRQIWIFTDSPQQIPPMILETINPERVIGPDLVSRPIENLILMSNGAAIIAANSTFSWWACLLSKPGTQIIAPKVGGAPVNNFHEGSEPCSDWSFLDA